MSPSHPERPRRRLARGALLWPALLSVLCWLLLYQVLGWWLVPVIVIVYGFLLVLATAQSAGGDGAGGTGS